jgi:thiamine biosynthesis lipoprotein
MVAGAAERRAFVEHVMGMPLSVHVQGPEAHGALVARAVEELVAELRLLDALFSTYRADSQISRLQRGEMELEGCDPLVREVHVLCEVARERTGGLFDAWACVPGRPGVFDPTGLVKTWALTRAARPLLAVDDKLGVAVGFAGDVLVRSGDGMPWSVGIEDPRDRSRTIARVPVTDGGVATSGGAARGDHIVQPSTGRPARGVASATVVGPSLLWADVFATAVVALGPGAVDWVGELHGTSGLLVLDDGTVHRWANEP